MDDSSFSLKPVMGRALTFEVDLCNIMGTLGPEFVLSQAACMASICRLLFDSTAKVDIIMEYDSRLSAYKRICCKKMHFVSYVALLIRQYL